MLNTILRFSIERRWLVLCSMVLVLAVGLWSLRHLPIDAVPDITNVQVQINTEAPGYSPLETEQRITYPVENALAGLPKLSYTRSVSRYGLSQVTVVFEGGTDIYFARSLVSQRLVELAGVLPAAAQPKMGPVSTGLGEVLMYTVRAVPGALNADGREYTSTQLREIQDWLIKPQLSRVKGVVEVNAIGGFTKQYHVLPQPSKMLLHKVSVSELVDALKANNTNRGAGFIERQGQQLLVRSPGQLNDIGDISDTVIGQRNSVPIRVSDVAEVSIGTALRSGTATRNGDETVLGTAMMLIGENSREVAKNAALKLQEIQLSLPQGVVVDVVYDRTTLVDKAVRTISKNLLEGALLVIVILFVMLGNIRAALIAAAVIPFSMLITMTGMVELGVSANLMSLGALDFGLIVDGAVIIVENAVRRLSHAQRQQGALALQDRLNVVYAATKEVIRPSLFGVAIITLVYFPIFSLTGVEGKMFHPMAMTVVLALLAAMLLSLTLVPAAVAIFLRRPILEKEGALQHRVRGAYAGMLRKAFAWRVAIVSFAIITFLGSVLLARTLGSEFIPQLNEGDVALHAIRIPGTGLEQSLAMQQRVEQVVAELPEVADVFSRIGTAEVATDPMPPNVADTYVMLKPKGEWPKPSKTPEELVKDMEKALAELPGNNYEFTQPIQMRFNELISGVRADLGVKIFGDDLQELLRAGNKVASIIRNIDGAADVRVEQVTGQPNLSIIPDRDALGRYGLSVDGFQQWLAAMFAGENAGVIYEGDRAFDVVVRLPENLRTNVDEIQYLPVPLPHADVSDGQFQALGYAINSGLKNQRSNVYAPMSELARVEESLAPTQISRENGKRKIVITSNVRGRDLGSFVQDVQAAVRAEANLPAGYWVEYGGSFEQLQSASSRLMWVVPMTLIMILALLVLAFSSWKDALIIFSGIPLALTGGILLLFIRDMPLSISAGVGFIALSGVAVLNGLVMLTFIRELWNETGDLTESVVQGAAVRLRPVLMTALVASLGFVPMAFNTGTGAEVQRPLATVVIGGIITSTLLTLIVLPILCQWIHGRTAKGSTTIHTAPHT